MSLTLLRTDRWTRWHVIGAVAMATLAVCTTFSAWRDIYEIAAGDEENSHIFLVPLVAFWMVWVRRMRFRHCRPSGTIVGPVLVACGWIIGSLGFQHGYQVLWHGGAVLVLHGCVLAVLGKNVLFRFFPAIAVLIFLIPFPTRVRQDIAIPLQGWTAEISQTMLGAIGIDTEVYGNVLSINGTDVTIAEACNGLRMVFPLILVSYAFSFGMPLRNSVRFLVLLASPLAAILCNVVRILPTVWLYGNVRNISIAEQ